MLLYFLLSLIAIGVLVLSELGRTILYTLGGILLFIGAGYGIFYAVIIIFGIGEIINESGPFIFFKENLTPICVGGIVLWVLGRGLLGKIYDNFKNSKKNNSQKNHDEDLYTKYKHVKKISKK